VSTFSVDVLMDVDFLCFLMNVLAGATSFRLVAVMIQPVRETDLAGGGDENSDIARVDSVRVVFF
jgi:hypothetical protein